MTDFTDISQPMAINRSGRAAVEMPLTGRAGWSYFITNNGQHAVDVYGWHGVAILEPGCSKLFSEEPDPLIELNDREAQDGER